MGLGDLGFGYTGLCFLPGFTETYGLAGILADNPFSSAGGGGARRVGPADRLLDRVFAPALEVSCRGCCRTADRFASYCAGVLRTRCAWVPQPAGALVAGAHRAHACL